MPSDNTTARPFRPIPTKPSVRGRRTWLRPVDEGDLEDYCRAVNEHEPGWWAGYPGAISLRQVEGWLEQVQARHGKDGWWFTICPLGSDEFLGQVWLWDVDHRVPGAEISIYVVHPGEGIGTDAIDAVVDFGFESRRLRRIWGFTGARNTRSVASFERCGFTVEGRLRGAGLHLGEPEDMVQFSMTVADWQALERPRAWDLNEA
jgi:RimJ/RimL family protein N-acetyltransferase